MEQKREIKKKRDVKIYIPLTIVLLIVIIGGLYWYKEYTKYISTDDAHIESDKISVSSKILGRIQHLYVDESDTVKAGQLLADLDSADLVSQKIQAIAAKAQAEASKVQAEAKLKYDEENIKVYEVGLAKAKEDYDRAKTQYAGDVITKEQYDHIKKACESAKAQLDASRSQLNVSKSQIGSTAAAIESSAAQIGVIETQLRNTRLYAASDGIIAKKWLMPGDIVQAGQSIYTISNNNKLWVTIYLEETKMDRVHLNQNVIYTIDAFSDEVFYGKIYSIGSNTASQFSLIPPNNASGNFTKVTQRVPLKVSIDGLTSGKKLSNYKILAGMSAVVKIVKD